MQKGSWTPSQPGVKPGIALEISQPWLVYDLRRVKAPSKTVWRSPAMDQQEEDDLLAELEQMGADDLEAELLSAPGINLPSVPNAKLPAHKQKEQDEMKALEAELAGMWCDFKFWIKCIL